MKVTRNLAKQFPYIVAWSEYIGSHSYYINAQLELANEEHAPSNAIYKSVDDGTWHTVDKVASEVTRSILDDAVVKIKGAK